MTLHAFTEEQIREAIEVSAIKAATLELAAAIGSLALPSPADEPTRNLLDALQHRITLARMDIDVWEKAVKAAPPPTPLPEEG